MIHRAADRFHLGLIVIIVGLAFALQWAHRLLTTILTPPDRSLRRSSLTPWRPTIFVAGGAAALLLLGLIPIPRHVVAPMSLQPAGAQAIFVSMAGFVQESDDRDTPITAGQPLVKLQNPDIQQQLLAAHAEVKRLDTQLQGLRGQRSSRREAAAQIPAIQQSLAAAQSRLQLRQQEADRLTITSPQPGQLYWPPASPAPPFDERQSHHWAGVPIEPANSGAYLSEGTLIGWVGDTNQRQAVVLVPQRQIELIRVGQPVSLLLAAWPSGTVTGTVRHVSASPVDTIPAELSRTGLIPESAVDVWKSPNYQVQVELDRQPVPLPIRLTGRASISVRSASILARLSRLLADALN